ncbi:MAG: serine/threonine-protein kinase [Gammaproteobacteria bacterium]
MFAKTKPVTLEGTRIGRYELKDVIGSGTFGDVYKAYDHELQRYVAIKVRSTDLVNRKFNKESIIREARIHALAEHSNIVPVYDILDYKKSVLIVMRLISGGDLDQILANQKKPFKVSQALKIMQKILWAMEYAHNLGIVHLDLKPGNIRISLSGEVLIMDFGIAKFLEEQSFLEGKPNGTPGYMSPEHINCQHMDARADIYSLGIILYKMLTGRHPFTKASTVSEMLKSHQETPVNKPSSLVKDIPEKVDKVVLKALEKNSRKRFHSCREFALALEKAMGIDCNIEDMDKELRWDHRAAVTLKVRIQCQPDEGFIFAEKVNLSVSGANLRVTSDIELGSKLFLEFYIPSDSEDDYLKVTTNATVLWKDLNEDQDDISIGVSFHDLQDMERYRISVYVRNRIMAGDIDELPTERTMTFS